MFPLFTILIKSMVEGLFLLIILGFFGVRIKITTKEGVRSMNDIMLYFVTPCVIIHAFQRQYDPLLLKNLLLSVLAAFISHAFSYILALIFIKNEKKHPKRHPVLK